MKKDLKIKNGNLVTLSKWLSRIPLHAELSRVRTQFLKAVEEHIILIDKKRLDILERYAKKDKDGKPVIVDVMEEDYTTKERTPTGEKKYDIPEEDVKKANKEFEDFLGEELTISLDGNKAKLEGVLEIIRLKTDGLGNQIVFSGTQAEQYEAWISAFEAAEQ